VTVHLGACRGDLEVRPDADRYLPQSWAAGRDRCRAAGIPDDERHEARWKVAVWQWVRSRRGGVAFDWLTSDEGYGAVPAFRWVLDRGGRAYVGEVPVSYRVATRDGGRRVEARGLLKPTARKGWGRAVVRQETGGVGVWKYRACEVFAARHRQRRVVAVNAATGEVKYFATTDRRRSVRTVLRVAFRRAVVEHPFRVAEQEVGFTHFEGRDDRARMRHLTPALVVLGFVSVHAAGLRKKVRVRRWSRCAGCGTSGRRPGSAAGAGWGRKPGRGRPSATTRPGTPPRTGHGSGIGSGRRKSYLRCSATRPRSPGAPNRTSIRSPRCPP